MTRISQRGSALVGNAPERQTLGRSRFEKVATRVCPRLSSPALSPSALLPPTVLRKGRIDEVEVRSRERGRRLLA